MNKLKLILTFLLPILSQIGKAQTYPYVVPNKDYVVNIITGSGLDARGVASAVDYVSGAVYTCGFVNTASSGKDLILVKFDSAGVQQWVASYDFNSLDDRARGLYVDGSGNVFVTGFSQGTSSGKDIVTIKYNSSGTQQWVARYNGTNNTDDEGYQVLVDGSSNVWVCGYATTASKGKDFQMLKYNSSGTLLSSPKRNGSANADDIAEKMVLSGNNLFVTGTVKNTTTNGDIYTLCLNTVSVTLTWSVSTNGSANGDDTGLDIKLDNGDVYVCGRINNTTTGDDYYFARLNFNTGATKYSNNYDGGYNGTDYATSMIPDALGNYGVTGIVANGSNTEYHTRLYDTSSVKWTHKQVLNGSYTSITPKIATDTIAQHFYVCGTYSNTSLQAMLYQLTPSGTKSWIQYHDDNTSGKDAFLDLVLDGVGRIYLPASVETSTTSVYDYKLVRYSQTPMYYVPDINDEISGTDFAYWSNMGQLIDTGGVIVTNVQYYNQQLNPAVYINDDNNIFFQFFHKDPTNTTSDSIYRINLNFLDKNPFAQVFPQDTASHFYNFLLPHCGSGITHVNGYKRLFVPNLYQGIDMHYYFNEVGMKYYFVVKPGYDPTSVFWDFNGATSSTITGSGNLNINCPMGRINYETPIIYQAIYISPTSYSLIPLTGASWSNISGDQYRFSVPSYTTGLPLVIEVRVGQNTSPTHAGMPDWQQTFAQTTGGDEEGMSVCTDSDGNSYFTGWASPGIMPIIAGTGYVQNINGIGSKDVWITKFGSANGVTSGSMPEADRHKWTTIIGGTSDDIPYSNAAYGNGSTGKLYICGSTTSSDFYINQPNTEYYQGNNQGLGDGFVIGIDNFSGGQNVANRWSSYFGGDGSDIPRGIKVNQANGDIYMVGATSTSAYSSQNCVGSTDNGFPNCNSVSGAIHINYEGGTTDGFIAKFNSSCVLQQTSFIGSDGDDELRSVDLNSSNLYIGGFTNSSSNLPLNSTTGEYAQNAIAGGIDGYIARFNSSLAFTWSTLFGGSGDDEIRTVGIDAGGKIVIGGYTESSVVSNVSCGVPTNNGFPLCNLSGSNYQGTFGGGTSDGFLASFNSSNVLAWSTYYGDINDDEINSLSCGPSGNIYFGGTSYYVTNSSNNITIFNSAYNNGFYNSNSGINNVGFIGCLNNNYLGQYSTFISRGINQSANCLANFEATGKYFYMTGKTDPFILTGGIAFYPHTGNIGMTPTSPACCPNAYNSGYTFKGGNTDAYVLRYNVNYMYMPGYNELELKEGNSIITYPNPFEIGVTVSTRRNLSKTSLEIIDMQGRLIKQIYFDNFNQDENKVIDLSDLRQGIYIMNVKSNELNSTFKIVKQ